MLRLDRRSFLRSVGLSAGVLGLNMSGVASALEGSAVARTLGLADEPLMLARVWVDRATSHLLAAFDDTHFVWEDGSVELLLWPGDLGRLVATGLRYEITVRDVAARDAAREAAAVRPAGLAPQPGETANGKYRTLEQHNADLQRLADENPDICVLFSLPFLSLQGRTVYGVEIAENVEKRDGRPVFYNDGIHHSREWPAAEMPIMWAFDLIESYRRATDPTVPDDERDPHDDRMLNIVRNSRNIIVPVMNPDGFDYSRTGPAGTGRDVFDSGLTGFIPVAGMQYWRKNMRGATVSGQSVNPGLESKIPNNGVVPTTPGAVGVDPNRNYSYRWGGNGSSASQISQTYRGHEPFSEPEARNVQWILQSYHCIAGITHHTSGDLVLWAWGDTHDDAPDDAVLARLGFACGDYNGYRPTKSIDLYVTTGTCSDYMYGAFGSISYTFEHAGNSFHPPYLEVVPQFYANNREALMLMCELICLEPEQRSYMKTAVAANPDVQRHLQGAFFENISNTNYDYPIDNALDLDARYHCVLTGRLVHDGAPVPGQIRITKTYTNELSPGNPVSQPNWPESLDAQIETEPDGTFRWIVYPSTQPYEEFLGGHQEFTVRFESDHGGHTVAHERSVFITRGDVLDLGDIALS